LAPENEHFKKITHQGHGVEPHSFDDLAIELVDSTLARGQALKYIGAALLGGWRLLRGLARLPMRPMREEEDEE
jgi:predicted DCC family thiol-disulfide oxidoreductase YuxK